MKQFEVIDQEKFLYDSDDVASYKTGIHGWVDRHGHYWGKDEHMARWSGCTHKKCECGNVYDKNWTKCLKCRQIAEKDRYNKYERINWDGETPLYSHSHSEYFFNDEELIEFLSEQLEEYENINLEDIDNFMLVVCKPNYFYEVDIDYFQDVLPDDECEIDDEIKKAMDHLNEIIRKQPPASWSPGNKVPYNYEILELYKNN
jgi:hypothetical protein